MKKFLAILMAMMLVFSVCGVAMADSYDDMKTITLKKVYKSIGSTAESPKETFSFSKLTCTKVEDAATGVDTTNAPVPTIGSVTYENGEVGYTTKEKEKDITINLPEYTSVGVYTYTFTETDGKTAGVDYRKNAITLVVTVIEQNGKVRVAAVHTEDEGGEKSGSFDNTYSAGTLKVTKQVTGILGDKTKEFIVKVTFTAPEDKTVKSDITYEKGTEKKTISADSWKDGSVTEEITITDGETITFSNIPYGVSYAVEENDYTADGYKTEYQTSFKHLDWKVDSVTSDPVITINNDKGGEIDTGVYTDNMPYVILLGIVVLAGAVMLMKRRSYNG